MRIVRSAGALFLVAALGGSCQDGTIDSPPQDVSERVHDDITFGTQVHLLPKQDDGPAIGLVAPAPTGPNMLLYYGGKVVPNAKVHNINWNNTVNSQVQPKMTGFYTGVLNSPYIDWLNEYNTVGKNGQDGQPGSNQSIGRGTLGVVVTLTPGAGGTNLTDAQIQTEISNQINSGVLPQPDNNSIYAINFPTGTTITSGGSQSCVAGGFCAYHGTFKKGTQNVYYAVLPSLAPGSGCNTGCGNSPNFLDNTTSVSSHEIIETITDAEVGLATVVGRPLAWYNTSQGEIGDICNAVQGTIVGGDGNTYTVQKEYDNVTGTCIVSKTAQGNDFSISLNPTSVTVTQGGTATVTVNTAIVSGSPGAISLSISGLPSGVTATFNPGSVSPGSSSTLILTASATATVGNSTLTVSGVSGATTHTATESLSVASSGGGDVVLTNGVPVTNLSGARNNQKFFRIDVPAGATNLNIHISGGTGDADLYTRFGARPTLSTFNCRPFVNGNNETCTVASPQTGTYFIMINGFSAYSGVTLVASFSTGGPPPPPTCAHPICSTGGRLTSGCDPCVTQICGQDPFCCNNSWDSICVGEVTSICGQTCP